MANRITSQQTNVIFVDLEEEDDEVIELLPHSHSEEIQSTEEVEKLDETIQNVQRNETDRKKIIQQCLALLLHAQKCDIVQEEMSEVQMQCVQSQCRTMKNLLKHQETCTEGQNCKTLRCSSSRMILKHWINCKRENCQLCSPLRDKFKEQPTEEEKSSNNINEELQEPNADANIQFLSSVSRTEMNDYIPTENNNLVLNIFASSLAKTSNLPVSEGIPSNSAPITHPQPEITPTNPQTIGKRRNYDYNVAPRRWRTFPNQSSGFALRNHTQRSLSFNSRSNSDGSRPIRFFNLNGGRFYPNRIVSSLRRRDSRANRQFPQNEDRKSIQHQVMLLIHACKCQKREEQKTGPPCTSQACKITKNLLDHVKMCRNTARCSFQRCISSKRLLLHLNRCTREDCSLCSPLRRKCYAFLKGRGNPSNVGDGNGSFSRNRSSGERGNFGSQG